MKPYILQILNGKVGGRTKNIENTNWHSQQQTKQQKLRAPIDKTKIARALGEVGLFSIGRAGGPPRLRGGRARARARARAR